MTMLMQRRRPYNLVVAGVILLFGVLCSPLTLSIWVRSATLSQHHGTYPDPVHTAATTMFTATTSSSSTCLHQQQQRQSKMARRWNGNYQHVSTQWKDIPKSKRIRQLNVTDTTSLNVTTAAATTTFTNTSTTISLEKKRMETLQHVLTKAVLWKLFRQEYDHMEIELAMGDPDYLPDVVGWNDTDTNDSSSNSSITRSREDKDTAATTAAIYATLVTPLFWGESGRMKPHKALDLMQRYPQAHIVHCRWGMEIEAFERPMVEYMIREMQEERLQDPAEWWQGQFTFASLPLDVWRFFDEETGEILVTKEDLEWKELDVAAILKEASSVRGGGSK